MSENIWVEVCELAQMCLRKLETEVSEISDGWYRIGDLRIRRSPSPSLILRQGKRREGRISFYRREEVLFQVSVVYATGIALAVLGERWCKIVQYTEGKPPIFRDFSKSSHVARAILNASLLPELAKRLPQ